MVDCKSANKASERDNNTGLIFYVFSTVQTGLSNLNCVDPEHLIRVYTDCHDLNSACLIWNLEVV